MAYRIDIKMFLTSTCCYVQCLKQRTSWGFPMAARTDARAQ